jgi:hypothetical protein
MEADVLEALAAEDMSNRPHGVQHGATIAGGTQYDPKRQFSSLNLPNPARSSQANDDLRAKPTSALSKALSCPPDLRPDFTIPATDATAATTVLQADDDALQAHVISPPRATSPPRGALPLYLADDDYDSKLTSTAGSEDQSSDDHPDDSPSPPGVSKAAADVRTQRLWTALRDSLSTLVTVPEAVRRSTSEEITGTHLAPGPPRSWSADASPSNDNTREKGRARILPLSQLPDADGIQLQRTSSYQEALREEDADDEGPATPNSSA